MTIILILSILIVVIGLLLCISLYFYNRRAIICDDRKKLSELIGVNFNGIEIIDIRYNVENNGYTRLCVFIRETRSLEECEYIVAERTVKSESDLAPVGDIRYLDTLGIKMDDIVQLGFNFEEITQGHWIVPYSIYWYQLQDTYSDQSNVAFLTWIPRRVSMNVEKIMIDH